MKHKNVETNLSAYIRILNKIHLQPAPAAGELKNAFTALRERAQKGEPEEALLPETFVVVMAAVEAAMGLKMHEVQLLAAIAMMRGRIAELPTGEGKTLAAVPVACMGALSGKGVHVLTFNDYLAKRDANWMKPVYELLGLRAGFIGEGMSAAERKAAYGADITYLTAKEAGFDYLRSFLAFEPEAVVQRPFHLAIVDEADSIMIDEARIPLVVAGDMPARVTIEKEIFDAVSRMVKDVHFESDEYSDNLMLTEEGVSFLEKTLGVGNLYDEGNNQTLTKINVTMQAVFLLKRDVDYILRDGEVLLVDEFTGRVVKNREWPDGLQAAVEIKEGLKPKAHGVVMNRITLRDFLQFYPGLCGMTGTAAVSADDFYEFYSRQVAVIPPNKPCIRVDRADVVFADKESKITAVAEAIRKAHASGRPVLVGTRTVEESEQLADMVKPFIPGVSVLNAKNDEEEAEIIANAGRVGAVTISTNMAGRGVDIRLGGKNAEEYERVCALGGLYVIGTNRHESARIDRQLRGRAGRQGDPGESRFFVSLADDLMVKYRLADCLPKSYQSGIQNGPIDNPAVNRAIAHIQRVSEGQTLDAKITLSKYSNMLEDQRKIVHQKRMAILRGESAPSILGRTNPEKQREILTQVSAEEFANAEKQITLFAINLCWADHLLAAESAMDDVEVVSRSEDPLIHYSRKLIEAFDGMEKHIVEEVNAIYDRIVIENGRIDLGKMGVRGPSSTRTYLVTDGTEMLTLFGNLPAASFNAPLYGFYLLAAYFGKRRKKHE